MIESILLAVEVVAGSFVCVLAIVFAQLVLVVLGVEKDK